jgi:hypothetical protein
VPVLPSNGNRQALKHLGRAIDQQHVTLAGARTETRSGNLRGQALAPGERDGAIAVALARPSSERERELATKILMLRASLAAPEDPQEAE